MNVLVTTDFSNDAYNALFYATQLYIETECHFHILHVYDRQSHFKKEYDHYQGEKSLKQFLKDRTDECLKETRHRIIGDTEKNPLHKFTVIGIYDSFVKGVKTYMRNNPVDLMVMGTKGRTGAKEIFFGGNTIQMVKSNTSCPLLCVPKEIDFKPISQLGFLTDYKRTLPFAGLEVVKSLTRANGAVIHILHVGEDNAETDAQKSNKELLAGFFENIELQFHNIPRSKSKAKTVAKYVEEHQIDLLAMTYYPHYLLKKLFREPVVMDLSIYMEKPLLILPDQA